jgi:acyl-CoA thioester hydrolase
VSEAAAFDLPSAFTVEATAEPDELDHYGHVNNAVYLRWLERCAWAHSASVGLPPEVCAGELRRGMAVRRSEVDYLRAAYAGDRLTVGTWVVAVSRLRAVRRFQIVRESDGATLVRADLDYVCINLDTGTPSRMPPAFVDGYRVLPEVTAALKRRDAREPDAGRPGCNAT